MSDFVQTFRKEFGDNAIFRLGDGKLSDIEVRSTGSLMLDLALGGGWAKGRLHLLAGAEKAGKSSIAYLSIAQAQQEEPDKDNVVIDLEHSLNPRWCSLLGVDMEKLMVVQPDAPAEKVYDMIEYMIKEGNFAYIILDSVDGLVMKAELEEEDWGKESRVGGTSKINSMAMRKIVNSGLLSKSGTSMIFIQQLRDKIGGFNPYGPSTQTSGGRAIKHNSTATVDVSMGEMFTKGNGKDRKHFGQQIRCKVSKNKIAPPFKTATIDVYYEQGVDRIGELVAIAKEINVLEGTSWLKLMDPRTGEVFMDEEGNELKWHGINKVKESLMDDVEFNEGKMYLKINDLVNGVIRGT